MKGLVSPLQVLYRWETETPHKIYMRQPKGGGVWEELTWKDVCEQVRKLASFIKAQNLPPKSNISIFSKNASYWMIADLAIWMSGHVSVPIYPMIDGETLSYVLEHSESKMIFIGRVDNWDSIKGNIPESIIKVTFPIHTAQVFIPWSDIIETQEPLKGFPLSPLEDVATIIYTSGTTGEPKGVVHSFESLSFAANNALKIVTLSKTDKFFSYLPLAHVAERVLVEIGCLYCNGVVSFIESKEKFMENLKEIQPTVFLAVPFVWSTIVKKVNTKFGEAKLKKLLKIPLLSFLLKRLIKKATGLSCIKFAFTGAAPISRDILLWFDILGIKIIEVYGMTENLAYGVINLERKHFGSVGIPFPYVHFRLTLNGEILIKSPTNMISYFKEPKMTQESFEKKFFRTGDMGKINEEGRLEIIGRVKENFKTSKGLYISPNTIELKFSQNPLVDMICIIGAGFPQPMALIVLSDEGKKMKQDFVFASLSKQKDSINKDLLQHERIEKIIVLKEDWTVENGKLTPTLKLKRHNIEKGLIRYFNKWFKEKDPVIWQH
jgi:long-subunit acyl-CoA synthetase (AMP-forming)